MKKIGHITINFGKQPPQKNGCCKELYEENLKYLNGENFQNKMNKLIK